jgi:hypothetical protein
MLQPKIFDRPNDRNSDQFIPRAFGESGIRHSAKLEEERARLESQDVVPFEKTLRPQFASKELTIWQSFRNSKGDSSVHKDNYFVATDGGLVRIRRRGKSLAPLQRS